MRLKLISCEVFYREMCLAVSRSPHMIDITFLPKGLHDIGSAGMRERMQAAVDAAEAEMLTESIAYSAILLGYGLCNNGLAGLQARTVPLVLPRAHDCITLFLGSRHRYVEYFNANPGTYFKTTGWIDRGSASGEFSQLSIQKQAGINTRLADFIAKYGEDNGRYLFEMLGDDRHNYGQYTFIEMGVEPNSSYADSTKAEADARGWKFESVKGDMRLIQQLTDGEWNQEEFLIVPHGSQVRAKYDERIVDIEPAEEILG